MASRTMQTADSPIYMPCTGLTMGIFPESDPGSVDLPSDFRIATIPSAAVRRPLARCSVSSHRSRNRQRRAAGRRHHGLHAYQIRCESGKHHVHQGPLDWLATFTRQAGFHQRLVDPAALSIPGFSTARFPAIPSSSLDPISPLALLGVPLTKLFPDSASAYRGTYGRTSGWI